MNKLLLLIVVFSIFFLTLKFEAINNLFILSTFALFFSQIRIKPLAFCFTLFISAILMSYFLFADNQTLLKYALYLLRFIALTYLIFLVLRLEIHLSSGLEIVFYVHASAIILSFIFPVLHDFLRLYFTYEGGSPFRFSGFIQGYDFVPFIMTIYLAYEYLNLSN